MSDVKNPLKNPTVKIRDAARLSGLTVHMIVYLGRHDILRPSGSVSKRGRARLYTFSDVIFLRVIADLLAVGIEVKRLRDALNKARAESSLWIDIQKEPRRHLITDGTEVFVLEADGDGDQNSRLKSLSANGQFAFAFVLDLGPTHKKISEEWPSRTVKIKSI